MTTTTDMGAVGTDLAISDDGSHLDRAAELEEMGYGALWIAGGQIDRLDRITEVLDATRRVAVGSSIIPTSEYGADGVAALYREAEAAHPGRFVLGLGARQAPRAMTELDAYLDRLDGTVPRERRILAALGPRKLALARDRFAGAVPLLVTPAYTAGARDVLGPDRLLVVHQPAVLDDDAARARDTARGMLQFLLTVRGYPENMRRMGLTDADVETVSDRLVDAVVAHGRPDAIAARVAEHRAAGADHVSVGLLGAPGPDGARTLTDALFGGRSAR